MTDTFDGRYELKFQNYTRQKPTTEILELRELGPRVTQLMQDGTVQAVHIKRHRKKVTTYGYGN